MKSKLYYLNYSVVLNFNAKELIEIVKGTKHSLFAISRSQGSSELINSLINNGARLLSLSDNQKDYEIYDAPTDDEKIIVFSL